MTQIEKFCKERDAAFLSLDEKKIRAFARKYVIPVPKNELVFWAGVHKAIVHLNSATNEQKTASIIWLIEHGFSPDIA